MSRPTARARANRRNAQASTGPRSADGKARVARNALRHGLNVPVRQDPELGEAAERLASLIAGGAPSEARHAAARRIAEAQLDLVRIRKLRLALLSDPLARHRVLSWGEVKQIMQIYKTWEDVDAAFDAMERLIATRIPEGATKTLEQGLDVLAPQLVKLDRYERRALSRRKTAIRVLEEIWAESDTAIHPESESEPSRR